MILGKENFQSKIRAEPYLTVEVLKRFFGTILMKGVIGLVALEDFYAEKLFSIAFPSSVGLLPKNLFFEISGNLIFPLKDVYDELIGTFQHHMQPGYWTVIDEIRIPSRHYDCPVKVYNNKKPDVWAIESKSLHDSSSYLLHFIYPLAEEKPTPKESVHIFIDYLKTTTRNHHVTCDSNFLSAEDISPLTTKSLKFTVSCKSNRPSELWSQALQVGLPQGYTRVVVGAGMVCACTKNNGLVNLASTYFTVEDNKTLYSSEMRRDVLSLYDETKGYADNFGHLVKAYYPDVKFRNYELTLLVGWMIYATTNAYILYNLRGGELSHREFQYAIASNLMNS